MLDSILDNVKAVENSSFKNLFLYRLRASTIVHPLEKIEKVFINFLLLST